MNNENCKLRVLNYLENKSVPVTARMISVSTGMQVNTAIKYVKFLSDEGCQIEKGWHPTRSTRVRTYKLIKGN